MLQAFLLVGWSWLTVVRSRQSTVAALCVGAAHAGSTFELLVVACSRAGVNHQVFIEEGNTHSISLQQPAAGWPVSTCLLPGVLSMQVVLEEATAAATAATPTATPPPAATTQE